MGSVMELLFQMLVYTEIISKYICYKKHYLIEAPLGGSTAAQSFWSKEGCDKERSLEEQSFEILVLL